MLLLYRNLKYVDFENKHWQRRLFIHKIRKGSPWNVC